MWSWVVFCPIVCIILFFLVASIHGIAVDILGLVASEIAYPWLSFILIVLYH
jgi:hypothetical protein